MLAREHDVIAVDLPGFGESPPGAETVDGLADEVVAFIDELALDRPHVAGNSMGGGLALALGATGRARTVCAISPIGFSAPREVAYGRATLATTRVLARAAAPIAPAVAGNTVLRTLLTAHITGRPWRLPADDAVLWTRRMAECPSFWPLLRDAPPWKAPTPLCPATIAWGDRDRLLIFSRQAPRARRRLPEARHVVLHGCGHVPPWDDPDQVARAIADTAR
jgi:pimeloyl-ACP methyl ester carboxylesterase